MPEIQFAVNVANGFAIDFANDVFPIWWMEEHEYPFPFNQSKSLLHAKMKLGFFHLCVHWIVNHITIGWIHDLQNKKMTLNLYVWRDI